MSSWMRSRLITLFGVGIALVAFARPASSPPALSPTASSSPSWPRPVSSPGPRAAAVTTVRITPNPQSHRAPGAAALRIARDPETGALRAPTPEESAALAGPAAIGRPESLPIIRLADGTKLVHLDERFIDYAVARRGADGRIVVESGPTAPAPTLEER